MAQNSVCANTLAGQSILTLHSMISLGRTPMYGGNTPVALSYKTSHLSWSASLSS